MEHLRSPVRPPAPKIWGVANVRVANVRVAIVRKKGVADVTKRGVADVTKKGVANVWMAYVPTPQKRVNWRYNLMSNKIV